MSIKDCPKVIQAIDKILEKGNTCELKMFKYGIVVTELKRETIIKPQKQEAEVK